MAKVKVRMIECSSGPKGLRRPGVEYDVEKEEAKRLCWAGQASPIGWDPGEKPAPPPPADEDESEDSDGAGALDGKFVLVPGTGAKPRKKIGPFDDKEAAELFAGDLELDNHEVEEYDADSHKPLHAPARIRKELTGS